MEPAEQQPRQQSWRDEKATKDDVQPPDSGPRTMAEFMLKTPKRRDARVPTTDPSSSHFSLRLEQSSSPISPLARLSQRYEARLQNPQRSSSVAAPILPSDDDELAIILRPDSLIPEILQGPTFKHAAPTMPRAPSSSPKRFVVKKSHHVAQSCQSRAAPPPAPLRLGAEQSRADSRQQQQRLRDLLDLPDERCMGYIRPFPSGFQYASEYEQEDGVV